MNLEEALQLCSPTQYLGRNIWIKNGRIMHLTSCAKTIEEIKHDLNLSLESLNADDWNIYEIRE
jgi:hypothetical protein